MPKNIADRLVKAFETAINDPQFKKFIISRNEDHEYLAPEQFYNYCEKQRKALGPIFEKAGLLKEK
jgi:tripartite-type tricarboxylate transporter receptor subunit TctC